MQSVVPLTVQYRMAEDIQLIANTLIYNGRLRCGSSQVGEAMLEAQIPPHLLGCYPAWLLQVYALAMAGTKSSFTGCESVANG